MNNPVSSRRISLPDRIRGCVLRGILFGLLWGALWGIGGCRSESALETTDAILWLNSTETIAPASSVSAIQHELIVLPASSGLLPEAAHQALEEAEGDLRIYMQSLAATREAIEEAVVMVREQRENFDYALDRFETLMPLVETGALEPLAASQIQSAYISARASLAQAKFFLGQARRDFGSEEFRRRRLSELQGRVTSLRQMVENNAVDQAEASNGVDEDTPAQENAGPKIEARFHGAKPVPEVGQLARVDWVDGKVSLSARVVEIRRKSKNHEVRSPAESAGAELPSVWLLPLEPLPEEIVWLGRSALPVRVRMLANSTNAFTPDEK
jgi:hypothetical protein